VTRARLHQLLVGLVRADRTFQAAVAVLARGSRETRQRQRAEAAATDLERAVTAVRIALRRSPSVLARGETRRVVSALASLESLLAAERQALSRPRTKGIATAARIERRRSAVERRALRVLSTAR
jgi:hypothetical protein